MNWFYRHYVRPVLFAQDPEHIHRFTLDMLRWVGRHFLMREALGTFFEAPELPVTVWGLRFPNPIGLAAGMDKEGEALPAWEALGFGHCELGAVTAQPQPGNPPPRLFRIIPDEAIINRMGFNNEGAAAVAEALARWRAAGAWPRHPVGINLGKSKVAPLDEAPADYARSLECLWPHADFFVVNVSSPNTPHLRDLQEREALDEILAALQEVNGRCAALAAGRPKPLLVKVAPDLSFAALDEILQLAGPRALAGLVATNTTIERPEGALDRSRVYAETGGLSGRPLRKRSTEVIGHLYRQTQGRLPIVGVGGIFDAADAWEKIAAGACLLQVYTGLVYEGPGLVRGIVRGLQARLSEMGLPDIPSAVGLAHRA